MMLAVADLAGDGHGAQVELVVVPDEERSEPGENCTRDAGARRPQGRLRGLRRADRHARGRAGEGRADDARRRRRNGGPRRDAVARRQRGPARGRHVPPHRGAPVRRRVGAAVRAAVDQPRPHRGRRRRQQGAGPLPDGRRRALPAGAVAARRCSPRSARSSRARASRCCWSGRPADVPADHHVRAGPARRGRPLRALDDLGGPRRGVRRGGVPRGRRAGGGVRPARRRPPRPRGVRRDREPAALPARAGGVRAHGRRPAGAGRRTREPGSSADAGRAPAATPRARYLRVPRRRRLWPSIVGWSLWAIIGLAVAIRAGSYIYLDDTLEAAAPDTPEAKAARAATTRRCCRASRTNILLIGSDTRPDEGDPGRSDSLILVRMDSKRDFISMLSFPRDLLVQIPDVGEGKINSAYSYGRRHDDQDDRGAHRRAGQRLRDHRLHRLRAAGGRGRRRLPRRRPPLLQQEHRHRRDELRRHRPAAGLPAAGRRRRARRSCATATTTADYARIARQQQFLSELKRQTKEVGNLTNVTSFRRIFGENIEISIRPTCRRFLGLLELALETAPNDKIARVTIQGSGNLVNGAAVEIASSRRSRPRSPSGRNPEFEEGEDADGQAGRPGRRSP